jgi:hypothetical protein
LGSWYAERVRGQFELPPELKLAVTKLTTHSASELERIKAIQQFVLHNTRYVALEFGAYSYKPYRVGEVYARRFGDCKDKASLMIAMLHEAGIKAELALIRTQKLGAIASGSAVLSAFNHAIVYIPKNGMWIDATADYAAINELPVEDQGAMEKRHCEQCRRPSRKTTQRDERLLQMYTRTARSPSAQVSGRVEKKLHRYGATSSLLTVGAIRCNAGSQRCFRQCT